MKYRNRDIHVTLYEGSDDDLKDIINAIGRIYRAPDVSNAPNDGAEIAARLTPKQRERLLNVACASIAAEIAVVDTDIRIKSRDN